MTGRTRFSPAEITWLVLAFIAALLAMVGLGVALSFEAVGLARLRKAANLAERRIWIDPVPSLPFIPS